MKKLYKNLLVIELVILISMLLWIIDKIFTSTEIILFDMIILIFGFGAWIVINIIQIIINPNKKKNVPRGTDVR